MRCLGLALAVMFLFASNAAAVEIPERRREQAQTTPGYILTPAAANIPGLGFTYGVIASFFNINDFETDVLGFKFFGDLSGQGAGVVDMFVLPNAPDLLTLNLFWNDFDRIAIETYRRGIDSDRDQRNIVELERFSVTIAQLNLRLFERRWQINVSGNRQQSKLASIRNKDGDIVTEGSGETQDGFNRSFGTIVDLTDDRSDPRDGLQAEIYRYDRPDPGKGQPYFYVMDYNLLYFLPIGHYSTLGFNLYRSDAVVVRQGETDEAKIKEELGFNCSQITDETQKSNCETVESQYVQETRSGNQHGTATPIGGTQRLRSYTTNRYYAAHSLSAGTEFRWNLTEEFTPFNIIVAGGVRTGIQVAFFAEGGTVADLTEDLYKDWKYSYGSGMRFILASGFVVRLDVASGSEGTQPSLIFQYPWNVF